MKPQNSQTIYTFAVRWRANRKRAFASWLRVLFRHDWVVYAKRPFGEPEHVLRYLGAYTHRVAISNSRLVALSEGNVTFRWRDSAHGNKKRLMTLPVEEFLRVIVVGVMDLSSKPDAFSMTGTQSLCLSAFKKLDPFPRVQSGFCGWFRERGLNTQGTKYRRILSSRLGIQYLKRGLQDSHFQQYRAYGPA